ncbi:MAG: PHP domain-containing protein [Bacilli bacterium]
MIDLHMHTKYSDGSDSLIELLENCEKANLEIISITDHDTCDAYDELNKLNVKNYFTGKIINGIEMTTSFQGYRIELLAYGFDNHIKVSDYLESFHTKKHWDNIYKSLRVEFLDRIDLMGILYEKEKFKDLSIDKFESKLYESFLKCNSNLKDILQEEYCETGYEFFRSCISNPKSQFYIKYATYNPDASYLVDFIHKNCGKIFLAHAFLYDIPNMKEFLDEINKIGIDGLECFHYSFTDEELIWIKDYATTNNLLISGGSDYHGTKREGIYLGKGKGNLNISKDIINNWNINNFL